MSQAKCLRFLNEYKSMNVGEGTTANVAQEVDSTHTSSLDLFLVGIHMLL